MERTFTVGRIYTGEEIEMAALCVDDETEDGFLLAYADYREYWFRREGGAYVLSHTWKAFLPAHKEEVPLKEETRQEAERVGIKGQRPGLWADLLCIIQAIEEGLKALIREKRGGREIK